jgi:hypothetical protein
MHTSSVSVSAGRQLLVLNIITLAIIGQTNDTNMRISVATYRTIEWLSENVVDLLVSTNYIFY